MRRIVHFILGLLPLLPATAAVAATSLRCVDATPLRENVTLASDASLALELRPAPGSVALLRIDEQGRDLEWRWLGDAAFQPIAARPPRLGLLALVLDGTRTLQLKAAGSNVNATAAVQLDCAPDADALALPACVATVSGSGDASSVATPSLLCRALAMHARAYAASRDNKPETSAPLYREAAELWRRLQDGPRQAAALLGVGEQSIRREKYREALRVSQRSRELALASSSGYYLARAGSQICLALQYLGRIDQAWRCMQELPALYQRLGEPNEAANAWYLIAAFAAENGKPGEVATALHAVDAIDPARLSPLVRGRLFYLRARLATEAGHIDDAVDALRQAIAVFDQVSDKRWQGNAYLRTAELYFQMGSLDEASDFVASAIHRLADAQARGRLGIAYLLQARLADARGDAELRQSALAESQRLLTKAERPLAEIEAAAFASTLDLRPTAQASLDERLRQHGNVPTYLRQMLDLAAAQRALAQQDWGAMEQALARLPAQGMGVAAQLQRDRLRASLLVATQRAPQALALLDSAVAELRQIATASRAPALRQIAARRLLELRRAWVDAYAALPPAQRPAPAALWQMLQSTQSAPLLRGAGPVEPANEDAVLQADRALAAELLPDSEQEPAELLAQKALLTLYATGARQPLPQQAAVIGLAQAQAALGEGELLLAVALGSHQAIALSISREHVASHELAATAQIRSSLAALLASIGDPRTPLNRIERDAATFSQAFLPAGVPRPAARLLLMADESLAAIPLAALRWPGDDFFLVEQAASSFLSAAAGRSGLAEPSRISVLTASLGEAARKDLPMLAGAEQEPRLLQQSLPPPWSARFSEAPLDRHSLRQALDGTGQWVHIAAHGTLRSGRQGYSGLWFGAAPEFIGWIDLVGRPLQAELLVLNACELGGSSAAVTGSSASFAAALSSAGLAHVVAGLWKVSDGAGALWVPVFYRELARAPAAGPATALRAAQLRLMQSRLFRHPFYWASMIHLQH